MTHFTLNLVGQIGDLDNIYYMTLKSSFKFKALLKFEPLYYISSTFNYMYFCMFPIIWLYLLSIRYMSKTIKFTKVLLRIYQFTNRSKRKQYSSTCMRLVIKYSNGQTPLLFVEFVHIIAV